MDVGNIRKEGDLPANCWRDRTVGRRRPLILTLVAGSRWADATAFYSHAGFSSSLVFLLKEEIVDPQCRYCWKCFPQMFSMVLPPSAIV